VPKGEALASERHRLHCAWVLLVGDDESDEDAFSPEGKTIAVRVGRERQSHANYFLRPQAEIDELLEQPGIAANKYEATPLRLRVL